MKLIYISVICFYGISLFASESSSVFSEVLPRGSKFVSPRFEFRFGNSEVALTYDGKFQVNGTPMEDLALGKGQIERVWRAEHGRDLLLLCEITDGETGWGYVFRLDTHHWRSKWRAELPGFNLAQPLVTSRAIYVAGHGFIGKLNLRSGRFVWKRQGLYASDHFNAFFTPLMRDGIAYFPEDAGKQSRTIEVQDSSGKILRPELHPCATLSAGAYGAPGCPEK